MRRLSPAQQEAVRMRVMAAIDAGLPVAEAARVFGVSTKSIGRWRARRDGGGAEALRSGKPGRKVGSCRFLSESEEAAVRQAIIEYCPEQLGLGGMLWTTRKVNEFLHRHFGVRFSHGGLCKLMDRMGLSFQRPDRRAREADPAAIEEWTRTTYPAIRARAAAENALVMFADQVGIRSDQVSGRTWGERGNTPIVARSGQRYGVNAMSVISTRGTMHFTVFADRFTAATCITFLKRVIGNFPEQKIHLIVDRHPVHRSKKVNAWVAEHTDSIELHFLPAYAPHLNPDELVNADLKRQLADKVIENRAQLEASTRSILHGIQKFPARVRGYFRAPHTRYAADTI
ncbi:IS630 family transposase [Streptomyces calidiresistens]|uniref:IS630 family transposase n=1 Tax=Streptomyces calidiresistens TaxID=1485586 RepID=A0A7W3T7M2_9ACTN|nr:IS630 family transposase [Streptomyces calidiresistens]MBB0232428.1 IS630 family transposase [Streptomyces calidiresistens]